MSNFVLNSGNIEQAASQNMVLNFASEAQAFNLLPIRDNTDFTVKYVPPPPSQIRFTKTVVVSQDPAPGAFIPAGTPVNLTLVSKDIIPIKQFNLDPKIQAAYAEKAIGDVFNDFASNQAALLVLQQGKAYSDLSASEAAPVNQYLQQKFGVNASDTQSAKNVYSDLLFLQNL